VYIVKVGLLLNSIGAVLLGLSTQFGLGAGFGGKIVWKNSLWKSLNILGWLLLLIGFLVQLRM
jgi:hypothetical protein